MAARPRTAPLLFGSLVAATGLGSFLVEAEVTSWSVVGGIVLLVVGTASLVGVLMRDRGEG